MDKIKEITRALEHLLDPALQEKFWREILTKKEIRDISSRWDSPRDLVRPIPLEKAGKPSGLKALAV